MENVQNDVTYFTEHDEAKRMVEEISSLSIELLFDESKSGSASNETKDDILEKLVSNVNKISDIVGKYMDIEVLLYQYIETLIGDIFEILKRFVLLPNALKFDITRRVDSKKSIPLITLEKLCFYLYIISKCVGVRRLINYAPNDVSLFEKITETIEMIQNTNSGTSETEISKHEDHLWCLEFIFLSWESLMVYTPFDLNTIWKHPFDEKITFQTRILTCSMYYLNKSTKARDGAAMVISNLFSRKDVLNSQDFQYFLKFCQDILTNPLYNVNLNQEYNKDYLAVTGSANNVNNHLSIGVLMVLKQIIKRVQTPDLIPYLDIFEFCLLNCDDIVVNSATKKLRSSCLGRLALHLLPPQEDSQKYRRKYRTIFTKKNSEEDKNGPQNTDLNPDLTDRKASAFDAARVEVMLSKILETLVDSDIRVRWACAKSVGRISSRLTIQMNEEILDHIIELINSQFTRTLNGTPADVLNINGNIISCLTSPKVVVQPLSAECESVVHGGCLAIAEILREGLIHPHMLNKVLDTTILTLSFEVWRGKGSAGTAVRDASCFICWAIARTFTKEMLSIDHVSRISMELVNVSLFDSSVNCRRAACSALQELVGRFGTVSKGLELIQICNYFTVSNRKKAFVEVCQQVARLGYYSNSMLQNVIRTKLFHPDMSTRELSSLAICKIVSATPHLSLSYINNYHTQSDNGDKLNNINDKQSIEFTVTSLIDYLLENLYTTSTSTTQGSLRALARLLYFVIERNIPVNLILFKVLDVPVTFEKKRLFRNKSSNIIRQAICKLITVNCKLMLHMNTLPTYNYNENMETFKKIIDYYIVILKDSLRNFALEVQLSAVEAFEQLFMIIRDADVSENLLKFFTDSLSSRSDHISARRGYALVFSSIPLRVFTDIDEEKNRSKTNNDNHTTHSEQKNNISEINTVNEVLTLLCNEIKTNVKYEEVKDSKTRQFALLSVLSILNRIKDHVLEKKILEQITETLVMCCNDYEIDSRGDVGSWVRELSSEVICYILNVYLFKNNNYRGNLSNTFKNMDKEMATNLTGGLVGLALENLEHVRSRSTFLMCHLFTNKLSKLNFKWIWNRIFYNIPYEQMISTNEDYCARTRYVSATNSTSTPSTRLDDETEERDGDSDADRDVDYEIEKYIDRNYEIDMYINIDNRLLDGFNMLFDISKSLIQVISATYENKTEFNSEYELDYQKSLLKQKYSVESNGLIPVNDCENLLEYSLTNTEKLNVVLRIPGWSAAPLTFRTFLWVLLIPSYTRVTFKSIVKIIGENNRIEVNIHANNSVLVLEDVLIEFISQNKDTFISWAKSVKCFEMVLRDCSLELYNQAIETNDSKTSQKLVNSLKILFSHRLVEVQEWYELIEIMINDAKRTTNYAYLKSIVRCLEVLLMYESESFTKEILKTLLQLLVHQYPTIRSYVASHLTLALSSREDVLAEEAMEILDSCSFHVEDEDTILKSIKKLSTLLKV